MAREGEPRIVRMPTDEEMKAIFETYAMAVGKVAYSWNFLLNDWGDCLL